MKITIQKESSIEGEEHSREEGRNLSEVFNNFSTASLESDFSSNNNYVNFYMNDEIKSFADIEKPNLFKENVKNHIIVCSSSFNSSVYHFILPLRARYLQKTRYIGESLWLPTTYFY
ncbi:MAG: hypothetical protein AAFO91_00345 [Bacteroidota bacterium]